MICNDLCPLRDERIQKKIYYSQSTTGHFTLPRINLLLARRNLTIVAEPDRKNINSHVFCIFNTPSCFSQVVSHTPGMSPGACSPCWDPTLWQSGSLLWAGSDRCGWTWRPTPRRWSQRRRSGRWGPQAPRTLEKVGENKAERGRGGWLLLSQMPRRNTFVYMCHMMVVCVSLSHVQIKTSLRWVYMLTEVYEADRRVSLYRWFLYVYGQVCISQRTIKDLLKIALQRKKPSK